MRTGRLTIREGKGKKDRMLWLREETLGLLGQWRQKSPVADPSGPLFCSLQGKTLSTVYLRKMVGRYGCRAGISKRVHPHMLRHSCGYYLANKGYDTRLIQDYLGHRNITHTVRYTRTAAARFEGLWR